MGRKYDIDSVRKIFLERNCKLLETEYINSHVKMKYICKLHPDEIQIIDLKHFYNRHQGCKYCSPRRKITYDDIRKEFEKRNYILVSDSYTNNKQSLIYICKKHIDYGEQYITYGNFFMGHGCMRCAAEYKGSQRKNEEEKVLMAFKDRDLICLDDISKVYKNNRSKMRYCCEKHSYIGYTNYFTLSNSKYQCKICALESISGENNYRWSRKTRRIGIDTERNHYLYIKWRKKVLEHDNYECSICESKEKLEVHHIRSYMSNPELRLKEYNGITLCKKCHCRFHSMFGYKNNTLEQFMKYVVIRRCELT